MPPKKSAAAAVQEQNVPTLKLVVEKGPSSGQTLDCRPGPRARVNIGRLVRGNSIVIRDSGISSKHLRIELDAASDPDRLSWIITDLDSSNGTFLNGELLDPLEPAALSDGDLIKFGEETSIRVEFVVGGAENETGSVNVRRNARRRVRGLDAIGEDAELGLRNSEDVEKVAEIEAEQGKSVGTRRTRNSAKNENLANDLGVSGVKGSVGVSTRRTRNSRKEENVDEIAVDVSAIEVKRPGGRGRGRKKQPVETISEEIEKEEPKSTHKACEEVKERSEVADDESEAEVKNSGTDGVVAGLASSSGIEECDVAVDVSVIKGKKAGGRGRGRKKQPVETISEEIEKEEPKSNHKAIEEVKERLEVAVDRSEAGVKNSGTDGVAAGLASSSGIKECNIAVDVSAIEVKKVGGRGRGRKKQPVETISEEIEKEEPKLSHKAYEEEKERSEVAVDELEAEVKNSGTDGVAAGLASSSGIKERDVAVDVSVIEGKKAGGRGRERKKQPVETISEEIEKEEPNLSHKAYEEEKERSEVAVDELEAEVKYSGTDGVAAGLASSSGVKECNVVDVGKGKIVLDLEKMTLGEWFKYMEVHETQYIIDKSEEMLAEMRRKAERCHEYMLQQKRLRG